MTTRWFVVMFLLAVLSAGMLVAQPVEAEAVTVSGTIPEYVYSTEVVSALPANADKVSNDYSITVTAVFQVTPSTAKWTKELVLEKFVSNGYSSGWLRGASASVTFGQNDGYSYSWGSIGIKEFEPFRNLERGVYRLTDGTTTAIAVVGTPSTDQVPDLSSSSYLMFFRIDGERLQGFVAVKHYTWVFAFQAVGTRTVFVPVSLAMMPAVGGSEAFSVNTRGLQSEPLSLVVCDATTGICATTQVAPRSPFTGGEVK